MDKHFKHMDERFQNLDNEMNFNSTDSDWASASEMLDNAMLDDAFKSAAANSITSQELNFNDIEDAFMDNAFRDASQNGKAVYSSEFWEDFQNKESDLYQDDSFFDASKHTKFDYNKAFWNDANIALKEEGLHFEYKEAYWKEAKKLLDKRDRKFFFYKWSAVAILLLLLGGGINQFGANHSRLIVADTNKQIKSKNSKNDLPIPIVKNDSENELIVNDNTYPNKLTEVSDTKEVPSLIEPNSDKSNSSLQSEFVENKDVNVNGKQEDLLIDDKKDQDIATIEKIDKTNKEKSEYIKPIEKFTYKEEGNLLSDIQNSNLLDIDYPNKAFATHSFGVKLSKGLGNNFENTIGMLSSRNAVYFDYVYAPNIKKSRFEYAANFGVYHMSLNNYEYKNNFSVHHESGLVDNYWYKMIYKDLVYLSTNLSLFYKFNPKHKLGVNFGTDRLFTSRIKTEYQEKENKPMSEAPQWGINNGVNNLDFRLGLTYEIALKENLSFTFDSNFGILDKMNDEYLLRENKDRDMSFMIGIRYNIFRINK